MIKDTEALQHFCEECAKHPFVTIDTEFHRERTYYSQLCLVQIAYPEHEDGNGENAVLVDALAPDLDLKPLYDLFQNKNVVKVFHAARQDLEIFFVEAGVFPEPFFDTQVAAMVCGFGEQVGYETLVRRICRKGLDKSSRFTDWKQRPLTKKQAAYALADVTHLRDIYLHLKAELKKTGREPWVEEELAVLLRPETYVVEPIDAWRRIKLRNTNKQYLAIVRELAKLREEWAKERNVPRNRVLKDDALLEIAGSKPRNLQELGKSRLLMRESRKGEFADALLQAIARGTKVPLDECPEPVQNGNRKTGNEGLAELLRVLLKAKAENAGVAQRLIASSSDLDLLANKEGDDLPALKGWRNEVFGEDAKRLMAGKVALSADGSKVRIVEVS